MLLLSPDAPVCEDQKNDPPAVKTFTMHKNDIKTILFPRCYFQELQKLRG